MASMPLFNALQSPGVSPEQQQIASGGPAGMYDKQGNLIQANPNSNPDGSDMTAFDKNPNKFGAIMNALPGGHSSTPMANALAAGGSGNYHSKVDDWKPLAAPKDAAPAKGGGSPLDMLKNIGG